MMNINLLEQKVLKEEKNSPLVRFGVASINFYQKHLSQHKHLTIFGVEVGISCKFTPSCSQYTKEAIQKKGFFKGTALGMYRIMRCNPFSKGGEDPVD